MADMPETEWIEWSGDKCPVPAGTRVNYRMRGYKDHDEDYVAIAGHLHWHLSAHPASIIAYRVVSA
ncbi:MAG: hypothetical protein ABW169_09500 [Sphingobium sp.]